jgi:hypothetical protein
MQAKGRRAFHPLQLRSATCTSPPTHLQALYLLAHVLHLHHLLLQVCGGLLEFRQVGHLLCQLRVLAAQRLGLVSQLGQLAVLQLKLLQGRSRGLRGGGGGGPRN